MPMPPQLAAAIASKSGGKGKVPAKKKPPMPPALMAAMAKRMEGKSKPPSPGMVMDSDADGM